MNYHNKSPSFYDEIKVALPADIQQNHHLLFTLYHVSCQKKPQEVQNSVESPVGYTVRKKKFRNSIENLCHVNLRKIPSQWLPILNDGKLNVGEFMLPVMVEQPPENYSYIPPDVQLPGTKWLDNHRPVFTVTVDAVTSVHTLNPFLDRFINLCEYLESRKIPPRIGEANIEREMKKALLEIQQSELEPLVKNLVVILDKLVELLVTTLKIGNQTLGLAPIVFETICLVSNKLSVC